ncbi:MAG: hypothetical protein LUF92_15735 [Clostridiales bacterium]|nr:hypothetical protein [Clostridiales bacterium]
MKLLQTLSSFSCEKDEDIENFLFSRAVEFENVSKARTYLICNQAQLENGQTDSEPLVIYGYITIGLKVLSVPISVSNRKRKELDGFSAKIHGEQIRDFPCYLIGQLSRASNVPKNSVSGDQLISFACDVIATSVEAVGGRYMMVECHDKDQWIHIYAKIGFKEKSRLQYEQQWMVQMIRKIGK